MASSALGRSYEDGETIIQQGEAGDCLYVIQEGQVDVFHEEDGKEVRLTTLNEKEFFGEVPLFERARNPGVVRASVRAVGSARVLTVDKKTILKRINQDPSLAYRILETMSRRIRQLEEDMVRLIIGD